MNETHRSAKGKRQPRFWNQQSRGYSLVGNCRNESLVSICMNISFSQHSNHHHHHQSTLPPRSAISRTSSKRVGRSAGPPLILTFPVRPWRIFSEDTSLSTYHVKDHRNKSLAIQQFQQIFQHQDTTVYHKNEFPPFITAPLEVFWLSHWLYPSLCFVTNQY